MASSDQWWPWESQMLLLPHGKHPAETSFHSLRSTFGIIPLFWATGPVLQTSACWAPVWAHLLTDPVPGAMMRQDFPRVSAWADRLHDGGQACEADPRPEGDWLAGDDVPKTMLPIVQVFFKEMWPVLESSCTLVTRYLQDKPADHRMPNKSFVPVSPDQLQQGSLTHDFCLPFNNQGLPGESRGRRMIVPYQLWMLQRLAKDLPLCGSSLQDLGAQQLLKLPELLRGCRLRKESRSWCRTGRTGLHLQPASSKLSCKTLFPHPSASLG